MRPEYIARQQAYARARLLREAEASGNVAETCRRHGVSRKTFYKWKRRYDGSLDSLRDRSRRPHHSPRQLSAELHQLIWRVAKKHRKKKAGLYRLHQLLCSHHGFTHSVGGLYKALRRLGFYGPAKRRRRRRYKRYERPHPGANVQIDAQYLDPIRLQPEYQFTAIDEYSRVRYARIYSEITPMQAVHFLRDALDYFQRLGLRVQQVQTDHGTEFTYAMLPHVQVEHPFERELRTEKIHHKLTPIGKPHLQGKVERSHRIDQEEFHSQTFYRTSEARKRAFQGHINYYNHHRPHGSLNWRSPIQHLQAWRDNPTVTYA